MISPSTEHGPSQVLDPLRQLRRAIEHAAHLLPAQGPITVFIHHNTLHAFEDLPFEQAVRRGAEVFGCQPYLTEEQFREALGKGRIRFADLQSVLEEDLGDQSSTPVPPASTRIGLRLAMLQNALPAGSPDELRWLIEETDTLRKIQSIAQRSYLISETRRWVMRDLRTWQGANWIVPDWVPRLFGKFREAEIEKWNEATWEAFSLEALWGVCRDGVEKVPVQNIEPIRWVRHRDLLLRVTDVDPDLWINGLMIRFCAAFLDQGVSDWLLPDRERGFFQSFCSVYRGSFAPPDRWFRGVRVELARLQDASIEPLESIAESLAALGVDEAEWDEYLSATLLCLPGWGGMIHEAEVRADRFAFPAPDDSLIGFLAVRLILERFALAHAARENLGYDRRLAELRDALRARIHPPPAPSTLERALPVFLLAQALGWSPEDLHGLSAEEWTALLREIEMFDSIERRRVFHLAYERRFREQTLDALALHVPRRIGEVGFRAPGSSNLAMANDANMGGLSLDNPPAENSDPSPSIRPRFQVITCLDEREESFRRHLEEVAPDCETFGTAGFFAIAMYYRGVAEARYTPLCPVVIQPKHWVEERPDNTHAAWDRRSRRVRRALGRTAHRVHLGTRGFAVAAVITGGLGVLATFPLVARVLFPGLTARLRHGAESFVQTAKSTRLQLERTDPNPGPESGGVGFTIEEMTEIAERVLRDIGLTQNFSRLVFTLGHGSHSMNNPHESAHDCGACGGAVGGPNGRAIAQILNNPTVRAGLAKRGLAIPADTVFVGGLHNTCNEYVKFADTDLIPRWHLAEFAEASAAVEEAVARNAHERARRFESAPLDITPANARLHMDGRAEDLAQVRPEWGHATNAICIVGRRERTRGLFLDRRAFLVSYDPTQDTTDAAVLTRTLQAVFPVCGGISLEYYFSHVDPNGYGCGTKLPHNITSLLGVMDGAVSDLRTGLPWQMVEIHEPVRLLIVCETTPEIMLAIMARQPPIGTMAAKGWVQLAVLDPHSAGIKIFRDGAFHDYHPRTARLPVAASSADWYRGWREHLEFAEINEPERRS